MQVTRPAATRSHRAGSRAKGFTLIELLVVIAIIAILAAILFPVFARARENARRASCQSNLKQISLGIFQYTQDYDEKMPHLGGGEVWNLLTQPYLKSTQIFACPSHSGRNVGLASQPTRISYGMNVAMAAGGDINTGGASLASINYPSELVMLADDDLGAKANQCYGYGAVDLPDDGGYVWMWWDPQGTHGGPSPVTAGPGNTTYMAGPDARHLETANIAYADGHVKAQRFTTISNPPAGITPVTNWKLWYRNAP